MSTPMYAPPLRVAPAVADNQVRMAWLLRVRKAARRALDAALAAPRKASVYISRAVHKLHLDAAASWFRRTATRLTRPLAKAAGRLGKDGALAAVTGLVTSPQGRAVLNTVGRALGKALGWVARKAYSGLDRALRCFGRPGNKAADKLFNGVVSLGGKIATVAAPVVHRVARLSDPTTTHARVLSSLCQSYVVHKLLRAFIANPWTRLLVEAVLVPAVLDSRLWQWVRGTWQETRTRVRTLRDQAQVVVDLERQADEQLLLVPDDLEDVHVVTTLQDQPVPANRAERRAAQRQGKRPQQ